MVFGCSHSPAAAQLSVCARGAVSETQHVAVQRPLCETSAWKGACLELKELI